MKIINQNKTSILDRMNCKVSVLRGIEKNSNKIKFEQMSFREMIDTIKLTYRSDEDENPEDDFGGDNNGGSFSTKSNKEKEKKEIEKYYNKKKIKLTYSVIQCAGHSLGFIPFVYQEATEDKNNRLIIYDIYKEKVVSSIIINPDKNSKDLISINEVDNMFKSYQLCFSSEVE
jgi:hypothetical protein